MAIAVLFGNNISAQPAKFYKARHHKGFVFDSSIFVMKSIIDERSRYTPSAKEIEKAEKLLREKLHSFNAKRINQGSGCPIIHKKLKKYFRQYIGYVNRNGEHVIWINFFWNKDLVDRAMFDIITINDGCSYYWDIEVNITKDELINLDINGRG
jgi:hypothetical protein